ncbi:MAG: hypothetical protein WDM89_13495 [Rhizomicrobium sp.]
MQTYVAALFASGKTSFAPGDQTDAAFYNIAAIIGGTPLKFLAAVPGILFGAVAWRAGGAGLDRAASLQHGA